MIMIDKAKTVEKRKNRYDSISKLTEKAEETEMISNYKQIATSCSYYPIVKEETVSFNKSKKRLELEYSQAIHSIRLYRIIIINFTSSFLENLIFIFFIPYATVNGIDYLMIYYSSVAMLILSAIVHIAYEYIKDRLSLRKAMLTKSVLSLIMGCNFTFTFTKKFTPGYLCICFIAVITNAVREGSLIKHLETVLNDVFVFRYIVNSGVVSFIMSSICIFFIHRFLDDSDNGYFIVFLIGGLMNIIAFLLILWEGKIESPGSSFIALNEDNVFY